jgi:hypothetical protein
MNTRLTVVLCTTATLLASCGFPVASAAPLQPQPRPPIHSPAPSPTGQGCGQP